MNLPLVQHYKKHLSQPYHSGKLPVMRGFDTDSGFTEITLPQEVYNRLMKVTNADPLNLCSVMSLVLFELARYYVPADYPLSIGHSLQLDSSNNDFVLFDNVTGSLDPREKVLEKRNEIHAIINKGSARFFDINALRDKDEDQGLFGLQLNIRVSAQHFPERYDGALLIDYCVKDGQAIRLYADSVEYPADYRESILNNLVHLLTGLIERRDLMVTALPEQERVMTFSKGERITYSDKKRLEQVLEYRASVSAQQTAIIDGDLKWSYAELNLQANMIAHSLISRGVNEGDFVAVMLPRGANMMAAIYGILKAGAAYVPVDPGYPENRRQYIIRDSKAKLVIVAEDATKLDNVIPITVLIQQSTADYNPEVTQDSSALAYMIYTSGSTGNPKGVMIEHHSVFNRIEWMQNHYVLSYGDVILQKTPISFDVSVWELFWWAISGATVSLLQPNGEKDPVTILNTIMRDNVTHLHFVPSMLDAFLDAIEAGESVEQAESLKVVFTSGEALTKRQVSRFFALVNTKTQSKLVNLYGPTEATVDVTYYECQQEEHLSSIPIGRPIQNTDIYILDKENQLVPIGVAGELCIGGVNLARGYWDRSELTKEKFIHSDTLCQRLYHTGDLVRWLQDGRIEYLGRIDHQVKIRGYRIELGEIETAILASSMVRDVRVIALSREDGGKYLAAYLIANNNYHKETLRQHLLDKLPEFMVPPWFIEMSAFPLTPNGKLNREQLPNPIKVSTSEQGRKAQTAAEKQLASIWCDVLSLEQVSVDDNFFNLGGDSITSLKVISQARKYGMEISFQSIFSHPSIAELVTQTSSVQDMNSNKYQPFSLLVEHDRDQLPDNIEDAYPLSVLQSGLIFQSEIQKGASWYHDIQVYSLKGKFQEGAFTQAVTRMVQEHPILRTSYHLEEFSEFIQCVHKEIAPPLFIKDWRHIHSSEKQDKFDLFLEEESHYKFNWKNPELIRIHIVILSDEEFRYVLSFHDSALDGWSINLFHSKLLHYYHDFMQKKEPAMVEHDDFLRKYIELEKKARSDKGAKQFWSKQLENYEPMPLPRLMAKTTDTPEIEYYDINISEPLSDSLRAVAAKLNVPVKNVLMAAHLRSLGVLTNKQSIITGYEHSGRPEEEGVTQAIGLFLNSIPFMVELQENESWDDFIKRINIQEAKFLPHRRYPMADMKRLLNTTDTLFESVFNFTHFHMLKSLETLPNMDGLDVRVRAETEFVLRAEFSQDAYSDKVNLSLHYHSNEFDISHIKRIASYYLNALSAIASDSGEFYQNQQLLSGSEIQLLKTVGQGPLCELGDLTFVDLLFEKAQANPDKVILKDAKKEVTYKQFSSAVASMASHLAEVSVPQTVVAVTMERSIDWIISIAGIMSAGQLYMPIDIDNPDARIQSLLEEGRVGQIICHPEQKKRLTQLTKKTFPHVLLTQFGDYEQVAGGELRLPELTDLAYVLFTSGSTGKPKGAMIEHQGMLNHMMAKIHDLKLSSEDVLAQTAPVTFDISVWQALTGLLSSTKTVVYDKEQQLDPVSFCAKIKGHGITVLEVVPSYFSILLEYLEQKEVELKPLRTIILTGEALKHELVARWFKLYPHIELVNAYGPTEASDDITHHTFTEAPDEIIIPIGRPIENMCIHILNSRNEPVPFGTPGEICVTGVGVGRGYINAPEKTDLAFEFDNALADWSIGRLYRTGDIGHWNVDGTLSYLGRIDEQIKIRGMRIEIGEIENALMTIDGVQNAAIVLDSNNQRERLVGFIQGEVKAELVKELAYELLPAYMVPSEILACDQIPLSAAGKVDKKALQQQASNIVDTSISTKEPLVTDEEKELATLWAKILNKSDQDLHRNSDFFAEGGTSLLAMSLAIHSKGRFALADIFSCRTLKKLASLDKRSSPSSIVKSLSQGCGDKVILCFSYAGGNAVNFQPIADQLSHHASVRILAVEMPGNDPTTKEKVQPLNEVIKCVIKEIQDMNIDDLTLWGHCSGVGAVVEFISQAADAKINVNQVIASGKLLRSKAVLEQQIQETKRMCDSDVINWLQKTTGLTLDAVYTPDLYQQLSASYRNDAIGGNLSLIKLWDLKRAFYNIPMLCLLAKDDPLTKDWKSLSDNWKQLSEDLTLELIDEGGHYFIKTQSETVSKVIASNLMFEKAEEPV